nr:hypothetical protein [Tessaracoccus coleopterorum]
MAFGDPDVEANRRAIAYHLSQGTTTIFASTVTEPIEKLEAQLTVLRACRRRARSAASTSRARSWRPRRRAPTTWRCCVTPTPSRSSG